MVVKLKADQFTGGDMVFSVRRRFRPNTTYLSQFYPSGGLTAEALRVSEEIRQQMKRTKKFKLSDEYYNIQQEIKNDKDDDAEYILQGIKEDVKEKVEEDIKEEVSKEIPEKPRTFLEALTAAYMRNAPTDVLRRTRKPKLPELSIDQKTLDEYFKQKPNEKTITEISQPKSETLPSLSIEEFIRRGKEKKRQSRV